MTFARFAAIRCGCAPTLLQILTLRRLITVYLDRAAVTTTSTTCSWRIADATCLAGTILGQAGLRLRRSARRPPARAHR